MNNLKESINEIYNNELITKLNNILIHFDNYKFIFKFYNGKNVINLQKISPLNNNNNNSQILLTLYLWGPLSQEILADRIFETDLKKISQVDLELILREIINFYGSGNFIKKFKDLY